MKKNFVVKTLTIFSLILLIVTTGCKRDTIDPIIPNPVVPVVPVDDALLVNANVSGIVLDESNAPVAGATVTSGAATATTNSFGIFSFRDIALSKNNGSVTVTKTGYFKGVRSFRTVAGKDHQVRIQLMQKTLSGTVNAASGGTINSNGGASINFPANAIVTSAGAAYAGTVNVYSRWIDPTANNLAYIVPGDLRGVSTNGAENILETYGMVGAELEDASGNTLKIAAGKTATVTFPLPPALSAKAAATIVLWHFDNATARWKEEGTATKSGTTYTAQVNKFSFWNCDLPYSNFIVLDYTLINAATNTPLVGTVTRIKLVSSGAFASGVTNSTGFVSGLVPPNEALVLEVISAACGTVVFSQNIGPFTANTSLANVNVTLPASQFINFTGKIVNCSAAPVTNGYISLYGSGGNNGFANTNATGDFSFSILNCTGSNYASNCKGFDNATSQQSAVITGTATTSAVNLGTITACGIVPGVDVYIAGFEPISASSSNAAKYWKNGIATSLTDGVKNGLAYSVFVSGNDVYVAGREENVSTGFSVAKVWKNGVVTNLTNGNAVAQANAVLVSGTDVYVAGSEAGVAKLWKNGVATNLNTGNPSGHGTSIFISGTNVYVGGTEGAKAIIWKNGVPASLAPTSVVSQVNSVFVSGTDVYAAGIEYIGSKNVARLWKNGVGTTLTSGASESKAHSVFVVGSDVYVAGNESNTTNFYTVAKLWKNGVATNLTNGLNYGHANNVVVKGTDVYVAGNEQIPTPAPGTGVNQAIILWKNGFPVNITNATYSAFTTSLFVK